MKKLHSTLLLIAVLVLFGAAAAQAGKQAICHFPPDDPANFHTIVVSDNAVANHVAKHEDLVGTCLENCEAACDDEDFCTQDVQADPDQCICLAEPRPAVNCDDSNPCTADSCDSGIGACLNNADILDGSACDDGDPGTTGEVCTGGECLVLSGNSINCRCAGGAVNIGAVGCEPGCTLGEPGNANSEQLCSTRCDDWGFGGPSQTTCFASSFCS